jgi:hypothetical protein
MAAAVPWPKSSTPRADRLGDKAAPIVARPSTTVARRVYLLVASTVKIGIEAALAVKITARDQRIFTTSAV